jgi:hypothetical protein
MRSQHPLVAALLVVWAVNDGFGFPFSRHVGYTSHFKKKGQQHQADDEVQDDFEGRSPFLLSGIRHVRATI